MDQTLQSIQEKIRAAATARGIDPDTALRIANAESVLSNSAKNPRSSARGLFQIVDETWKNFGGDPKLRNDLDENIRVGLNVIAGNRDSFLKRYGVEPTQQQIYGMHVLGTGDAFKVFNAKDDAAIKNIVPKKVIKANPYMDKMSVADFISFTQKKMDKKSPVAPSTTAIAKTETAPVPVPQAPRETMQQAPTKAPATKEVASAPMNRNMLEELGANYQAALGAIALADSAEDEEADELLMEKYAERFGDQTVDVPITSALSNVQLTYASPFEEPAPVQMSEGGDPSIPFPTDMSIDDIPEMPPNPTPEQEAEFLRKVEQMDARAYWKRRGPNSADELNYSPSRKMLDELYSGMGTEIPDSRDNTGMPIPTDDQMEQRKRDRYYANGGDVGVQKMAFGGIPYKPSAMISSDVKNQLSSAQAEWDAYNKAAGDYNNRLNEYNDRLNQYNDQINQYNESFVRNNDIFMPYTLETFTTKKGRQKITNQLYTPGTSAAKFLFTNRDKYQTFNPSELNKSFSIYNAEEPNTFYIRTGDNRTMAAPSRPGGDPGSGPATPARSVESVQAMVDQAKKRQKNLQLTYDVMEDPAKFNLSMPALFAKGGEAESGAELATYTVVPNSAAADYEKYLQLMKGVKNQQNMSSEQRNQAMNIRSKIFDPITEETLQRIRPGEDGRSLYQSPMLPREITAQNSPTTLFAGIPGAKVLESTGLKNTNTRGFIMAPASEGHMRTEDIIFLAPSLSKGALDILYKQSPKTINPNENPELSQRVTLAHEAEHLLKRRAGVDINDTFDNLTKQARDENYIRSLFKKPASALRKEFVDNAVTAASYLKDKFKVSLPGYFREGTKPSAFDEQVASLAGLEETFGVDLTQDPVLRETLFNDADVRRAFRAITGLRQTRLDAKDLAPHTLTPDVPYYPDASKIRNRTPTPVKRANGSPVYGEIPDSGGITPDTRAALTNYQVPNAREALAALKRIYGEGASNAESLVRGSSAAVPGTFGDIGQEFDIRGLRNLPTTEQLLKKYPQRMTQPTAETAKFEEVGQYMPPPIPPSAVSGTAKAMMKGLKESGPQVESIMRKLAPAAEPFNAISREAPAGIKLPSVDALIGDYKIMVDNIIPRDSTKYKPLVDMLDKKAKDYFYNVYGTDKDPIRKATKNGEIPMFDMKTFAEYSDAVQKTGVSMRDLLSKARTGDKKAEKAFEDLYDKMTGLRKVSDKSGSEYYDLSGKFGAEFPFLSRGELIESLSTLPADQLNKLSFPEAVIIGTQNYLKKRDPSRGSNVIFFPKKSVK